MQDSLKLMILAMILVMILAMILAYGTILTQKSARQSFKTLVKA